MDFSANMNFAMFVRRPFVVEAVEVTVDNIEEISKHVGTLRYKEDGGPYINVDRRLFPNIFRVYPGFWMTRMGDNIRCYSQQVFEKQFIKSDKNIDDWLEDLAKLVPEEVDINGNV